MMNAERESSGGGTISDEKIPARYRKALDVTPEEHAKARRNRALLWTITAAGMIGGYVSVNYGYILLSLPILGPTATPISTGIIAHIVAAAALKDARKMSTERTKMHPELTKYLAGRTVQG